MAPRSFFALFPILLIAACTTESATVDEDIPSGRNLMNKYTTVELSADLSHLSDASREMIPHLVAAAQEMDAMFWEEAFGDPDSLLTRISDPDLRSFARINYGPWDRIDGNGPFVPGFGPKPPGANFYPPDMTRGEFESAAAADPGFESSYTMVRRDESGALRAIPYREYFAQRVASAASHLRAAADLAEDAGLKRYLTLRAEALLTDEYRASDLAWLDMKENPIEVVIGPIENYEDKLLGLKTAHEAFILIKDLEWSARLSRYAALLPGLQRRLPVPDAYKQESPGSDSDLNAYDAVYYAGDANAGSKTIAINLPNDESVQLEKGTRRLQIKNVMRAKFDEILVPISNQLIAEDQRTSIGFDEFFSNVMFHEVAHGLGIKQVLDGSGTVRSALRERAAAIEEAKADVLGLFMIKMLIEDGELDADIQDHFVTFLAGIFRSVRFGASSAHGQANMIQFNFFRENEAFERDEGTGEYRVRPDEMSAAVDRLAGILIQLQGDGDYDGVAAFMDRYARTDAQLDGDLASLAHASIPVDIVFDQSAASP